jgi:hypothetical protein
VIRSFIVPALELLYAMLTKASKSNNSAVHVSGYSPIFLQLIIAGDPSPNGVPVKYQTPVWDHNSARSGKRTFQS